MNSAVLASHLRPPATASVDIPELRRKLLDLLPAASRLLLLGDIDSAFEDAYAERHPGTTFLDLDEDPIAAARSCDLVVIPDGFQALEDPLPTLKLLAAHGAPELRLYVEFDSPPEFFPGRPTETGETVSPFDFPAQARRGSRASMIKLLMDAGWMPHNADWTLAPGTRDKVTGIIVDAIRVFEPVAPRTEAARFAVVVPTTRTSELELNVNCSPGLGEVAAPIFAVRDAGNPAEALNTALPHIEQDWVLICHQDVYFPESFGLRLNAVLDGIAPEDRARSLIGFVGTAVDQAEGGYRNAGFTIDRLTRLDFADSEHAISFDEAALVIARDSLHRIDPAMGWHLWATEMCLRSICQHELFPRIVRLPLFHNSANDSTLTDSFGESSVRLLAKFPDFGPIPTLCGTIVATEPAPVAASAPVLAPAAAPVPATPAACCICAHPVSQWLPHPEIGARSEFMRLLDAVGSDLSVYACPACGSNDRDRHLWHYMNAVGLLDRMASARVLHIAPERHLEALLAQVPPRHYVRGDLHPQREGHLRLDVEALEFADGSFDLVICNHVLEHVGHPERALAEFHRCLSPGGVLIAQTPYSPTLRQTFEMNTPVSPAFARLFYGQADHVRLFGSDIVSLFHAAGFQGELLPHGVVLPGIDALAHGCNPREPFFCFSK